MINEAIKRERKIRLPVRVETIPLDTNFKIIQLRKEHEELVFEYQKLTYSHGDESNIHKRMHPEAIRLSKEIKKLEASIYDMLNILSEGKFFDPRNVVHSVSGSVIAKPGDWKVDDKFDLDRMSKFWFSAYGNNYALRPSVFEIVIFSPNNQKLIKYLKKYRATIDDMGGFPDSNVRLDEFFKGEPLERVESKKGPGDFEDYGNLYLLGNPKTTRSANMEARWSDFADCVIDLRKGQVLFYS